MSSGACNADAGGGRCDRPTGHPGDHFGPPPASAKALCGDRGPSGVAQCTKSRNHQGDHFDVKLDVSFPQPQPDGPSPLIPRSVRTRVELHRAQTAYGLIVLRDRLDTITVSTSEASRLRKRREQLTAELDAWTYLVQVTRGRDE